MNGVRMVILFAIFQPVTLLSGVIFAQEDRASFLFLSDQRIVTLETVDSSSAILNYINLGDTFEVLIARNLVFLESSGEACRGHLFKIEAPEDPSRLYETDYLIKPGDFVGYEIVGDFDFESELEAVYFKIAGRLLQLEPIEPRDFEFVVARIAEMNLEAEDMAAELQRSGFGRGFGTLIFAGSDDAAGLERFFSEEEIVPPIPLSTPLPRLPSSEKDLPDPVVVRVSAVITASGGLKDVEVSEGINDRLNRIAVETVQNSWVFLPAISGTKVAQAELKLNVLFRR